MTTEAVVEVEASTGAGDKGGRIEVDVGEEVVGVVQVKVQGLVG